MEFQQTSSEQAVLDDPKMRADLEHGLQVLARIIARAILKEIGQAKGPAVPSTDAASYTVLGGSEKLVFSVSETATLLGVSRTKVYDAVLTKQIPSISFGRRILIPKVTLLKLLTEIGQ
jgi:excisionase family DNA binding protein